MKGRKKPDQLVNAQNKNPGFVVQIPEGFYVNCQNNIQFHPLIVPKNLNNKTVFNLICPIFATFLGVVRCD